VMRIPEAVQKIMAALEGAGYAAHCVGGCVRDSLLGRTPGDWDVTTSALPEQVLTLFGEGAIPTGLRHGTVTVRSEQGPVEVTTHRKDGDYLDCRRPSTVDFSASLEEDLARRDFTVNAMALDLRGRLTDPFGGREDLQRRVLRCVGDPESRFREDGLRIIRGLRFAAQLGVAVEEETAAAIERCRGLLGHIAAERLETELTKLLCGEYVLEVLLAWPEVLGVILPELLPAVGFDQRNRHHCYDLWEHTARVVAGVPADAVLRWSALLHDVGKVDTFTLDENGQGHFRGHGEHSYALAERALERLRMDHARRDEILALVRWHDAIPEPTERGVRRALCRHGEERLRRLLCLQRADNLAQAPAYRDRQQQLDQVEALLEAVLREEQCFSLAKLAVKGNDLLAVGMKGKAIGDMLQMLLNRVVDGDLPNQRDVLLQAAEEMRE